MARSDVRVMGVARRDRASLLLTTALQAAVLTVIAIPHQAGAQPAPNARPSGGQVVAGSAQITQPNAATTVITQSTPRAAVNWTSFNVGAKQSVDFVQPSSSAMTLNRVTGPDPSAIAGQIHANGGVVLTNPNGVTFYKGAQVNAQNVIVSTAGITNSNFMAGHLVFDQPGNARARIDNAGTITVKETGLAALVAPAVANSGVISARLGHVVLAGAQAATLDMYGDGLLSVDVTKQVTQAPVGRDGKTATVLVTNTGTMVANGGQVLMTASAADGVVQNLVSAGGKITADSVGNKTGSIAINGTGGSIVISGRLAASGLAAGTTGGTVELNASKGVTLTRTARVDASGAAGGGTVAVGTTLARAVGGSSVHPAMTAATTNVAKGARITANATKSGNGGRVTVISIENTAMSGTIDAKGGPAAGNGGTVEVSTGGTFSIDGSIDVTAAHGMLGDILLDPYDLIIANSFSSITPVDNTNPNVAYTNGGTVAGTSGTLTPATIEALHGNIHLQAVDDIDVNASVALTTVGQGFTLEAGNNLTVSGGSTISTAGSIALLAASSGIPGFNVGGTLEMIGSVISSGGAILLQGGTGGVIVAGQVTAPTGSLVDIKGDVVDILSGTLGQASPLGGAGGFVVVPGGQLTIEPYTFGHPVELIGTASTATANTLSISTSELSLVNAATLALDTLQVSGSTTTVSGALTIGKGNDPVLLGTIGQLDVFASTVTQGARLTVGTLSGTTGTTTLTNASNQIGTIANLSANALSFQDAIPLTIAGTDLVAGPAIIGDTASVTLTGQLGAKGTLAFNVSGAVTETGTGSIVDLGTPLTLSGSAGTLTLANFNSIDVLGSFTTTSGPLSITDAQPLTVAGPVSVSTGALTLTEQGGAISLLGNVTAPSVILTATDVVHQGNGTLSTTTLSASGTDISFTDFNTIVTLGSITATTGSVAVISNSDVTVTGPIAAPNAISLTSTGNLTLIGGLTTPATGTTTLTAPGTISEIGGGLITTGTLNGTAGGGAFLTEPNGIGNIGSFTSTGGFVLNQNTTALTIVGSLSDTASIAISTQGQILLGGTITAPLVSLATTESFPSLNSGTTPVTAGQLASIESIIQTGGAINAGTLSINSAGGVNMLPGVNSVANLGAITVASLFNLSDAQSVTIGGPATITGPTLNAGAGNDFYYQFYVATPGDITVAAPISGAVVGLFPTGALTETAAGSITAGFLQGTAGSINLGQAANAIGEIDLLTSAADLTVSDGIALTINGAVSAGGTNTLFINNDSLTLGASAALSAGTVDIAPVNPNEALTVGNATGLANLNAITADTLVLGSPTAGFVTVVTSGSNFDTSGVGTLALVSGAVVVDSGSFGIIANTLTGNAAVASLTGANQITTLGSFATSGSFALTTANPNATPLTVAGPLSASTVTLVATNPIAITGPISATTVNLTSLGGVTETGGSIVATTLNATEGAIGGEESTAAIALTGANSIANIGQVTSGSGGFSLLDGAPLTIGGGIGATGPIGIVTAGSLAINGPIGGAAAAISLSASGPIAAGTGGVLTGASLTGSSTGSVTLGQANAIGTLGSFNSNGGFAFNDSTALAVSGPVSDSASIGITASGLLAIGGTLEAPVVSLSAAGEIALSNDIVASSRVALASEAGGIVQAAGAITTPVLSGSSGGAALLSGANFIPTLGDFTATGAFSLTDTSSLAVAGALTAASVNLASSGAITEANTASIVTGALSGSGTSVALTAAGNQIAGLGAVATGGTFDLVDSVPLTIAGTVSAGSATSAVITIADNNPSFAAGGALSVPNGSIFLAPTDGVSTLTLGGGGGAATTASTVVIGSLTGGPIAITGSLNLSGVQTVFLESGGAIAESGAGALSAPLVLGTAASAALGGANTIAALGSFATTGAFALNDTANLLLTGRLSASTAALVSAGTLSEGAAGSIVAGTLSGGANVATVTGSNTIATLGAITATNGFALVDSTPLSVVGPVRGGSAVAIATAGSLDIAGTLSGSSVGLTPSGTLTESTGIIIAGTLTGSATGASLNGQNAISSLGNFTVPGGLLLLDTTALNIIGAVNAGPFAIFDTTSLISESGAGAVTAATLNASAGTLALGGANLIGTLALASATGGVLLNDSQPLTVSGPAGGAGVTSLSAAGPIAVIGSLSGSTVNLAATGAVTESGAGAISAGTLTGSGSSVVLTGANTIGALGSLAAGSALTLADGRGLDIAGPVSATAVALAVNGGLTESTGAITASTLTANATSISLGGGNVIVATGSLVTGGALALNDLADLSLGGPVSGSSVSLIGAGAIAENGGVITTGSLALSANQATLGGANSIANLGAVNTKTGLTLSTVNGALTVAGPVNAGGFLELTSPGALAITGVFGAGTVNLAVSGNVTEGSGGAINAGTLTGTVASASLGGANAIGSLGDFTAGGGLALNDTQALTVTGAVTAGGIALSDGAGIALAGNLNAGALNTVNLSAGGPVTQTGGIITAGTLTGSAGSANLGGANAFGVLAAFNSPGAVAVTDTQPLTVAGPVAASSLSLTDSGAIGLTGGVSANVLTINAGGSIVQSDGTITVGLLTGSAVGSAIFGPDAPAPIANIGTLGAFSVTGGTLSVASNQAMTIAGPVDAAGLALSAPGSLTLDGGTINTSGGTLAVTSTSGSGRIVQTGTTTITSPSGATLVFQLPGAGSMSFADLEARATSVVLNTGSGTATGLVNVGALTVFGQAGGATLTGSAGGVSGPNAALSSAIAPAVNTNYTLNGCVIAAANCGVIVTQPPPVVVTQVASAPIGVVESVILPPNAGVSVVPGAFDDSTTAGGSARSAFRIPFLSGLLSFVFSRDVEDPDLVLPNISDRDY